MATNSRASEPTEIAGGRVRWLNNRENDAWRSYLRAHDVLTACLNRQLQQQSGLSAADYGVLVILSEAPDHRARPYELADSLQWEKSRLSHHLRRMESRALVQRSDCASDARGSVIEITATGMQAIASAAPRHVADVRALFLDALDDEQLSALLSINEAILASVLDAEADVAADDQRLGAEDRRSE